MIWEWARRESRVPSRNSILKYEIIKNIHKQKLNQNEKLVHTHIVCEVYQNAV